MKLKYSVGLAAMLGATLLTCASANAATKGDIYKPGSSPTYNRTPVQPGFACMSELTSKRPVRFAVGAVKDYTGKFSNEAAEGGFKITQGGSLMVISGLGKLDGVELIERLDTGVSDLELGLTRNQLVQDPVRDPKTGGDASVRGVQAGTYYGSDYYIVGGITEVNYNIRSGGAELNVAGIGGGRRYYAMNVAVDLRLVETRTLRVVKTVSVQKQFVGREVKAGVFRFFGDYLVDFNAGSKTQEPLQLGVRSALEMGLLELVSNAYGQPDFYSQQCLPAIEASFVQ